MHELQQSNLVFMRLGQDAIAQTAAPTGWTKDTTNNDDSAIRVVTGTAEQVVQMRSRLWMPAVGTINSSVSGPQDRRTLNIADTIHFHYVFAATTG